MRAARGWSALAVGVSLACTARASVVFNCSASATGIAFGAYSPLSGAGAAATGSITVTCTATGSGSATVSGTLSLSTGSSGQYATRTMLSGTNKLDYNIYLTPAYTQILGNGTDGTYEFSESGTITAGQVYQVALTTYGYAPGSQNAAPGTYTDTIVATVTY
jgi:spore coat protein U-like protein